MVTYICKNMCGFTLGLKI